MLYISQLKDSKDVILPNVQVAKIDKYRIFAGNVESHTKGVSEYFTNKLLVIDTDDSSLELVSTKKIMRMLINNAEFIECAQQHGSYMSGLCNQLFVEVQNANNYSYYMGAGQSFWYEELFMKVLGFSWSIEKVSSPHLRNLIIDKKSIKISNPVIMMSSILGYYYHIRGIKTANKRVESILSPDDAEFTHPDGSLVYFSECIGSKKGIDITMSDPQVVVKRDNNKEDVLRFDFHFIWKVGENPAIDIIIS